MARTEVLDERGAEASADDLDRAVLDSETIAGGSNDAFLSAMTRTLAPGTSGPGTLALESGPPANAKTQVSAADPITEIEVLNSGEADDRSGETLVGRYQLVRQLGKGGMGTVYIARHATLPKTFAVKVLNARYAKRQDIAERFLQEAKAVSLIEHENVVGVVDFGREDSGAAFLVMEHLRGESLSLVCKREAPLAWDRVRHIMTQLCRALAAAHAAGIVHRDIKPENVVRVGRHDDPDFIKILDFGLAKMQVGGGLRLTQTGMVLGTPDYMSPEQARGRPTDHRADIYGAGAMMYELLCGRVPFKATTFAAMRQKHLLEPPEPPSKWAPEAGISPEMDAVVLKALAKDPNERFASMLDMGAAIEDVGTGRSTVELPQHPGSSLLAERSILDRKPSSGARPLAPTQDLDDVVGAKTPLAWATPSTAAATATATARDTDSHPVVAPAAPESNTVRQAALVALAVVAVFGALAGGYAAARAHGLLGGQTEAAHPEPAVATRVNRPPETAPLPTQIDLRFETNVPVVVLDEDREAIFGDRPGYVVTIPRGDASMRLILHADGYRDLHVVVTPNKDQILAAELELEPTPAPEPEPEAQPEATLEPKQPRRRSGRTDKEPDVPDEAKPEAKAPEAKAPGANEPESEPNFAPGIVDPFGG